MEKNPMQKSLNFKKKLAAQTALRSKEFCFSGITPKPKIGIL
jgi:hypothetical protein